MLTKMGVSCQLKRFLRKIEAANFANDSWKQNNLPLSSLQLVQLCRTNKYSLVLVRIRKSNMSRSENCDFLSKFFFTYLMSI